MGFGTLILFRQFKSPSIPSDGCRDKIKALDLKVSILKPLKGVDANLRENLESFFKIKSNHSFELLFSVESVRDEAYSIAAELCSRYPAVSSRIFVREETNRAHTGNNPKIQNLEESFDNASADLILISDSNVRFREAELDHLVSLLDSKTGMVTSIVSGIDFKGIGGALESVFLGTFYARFMAISNTYFKPCVVGKCMLFRRSDVNRFGGLKLLSPFLAEDFMAGEGMRKLGLQIKTARMPVLQVLGSYSFSSFWKRHVRWGKIRRAHAPLAFVAEPFFHTNSMSLVAAYALSHLYGLPFGAGYLISMSSLCILDGLSYLKVSTPSFLFTFSFPLVWLLRESLALPLWIKILSSNHIEWRGKQFTLAPGGLLGEK